MKALLIPIVFGAISGGHGGGHAGGSATTPITERPVGAVLHVEAPIVIDGRLDEPVWSQAKSIGPLMQEEPEEGVPATEETDVRLLYDSNNLYIGIRCYDREPDKIRGTKLNRDPDLNTDDRLRVLIDTFRDQRNAYEFEINPLGAKGDALLTNNGQNLNKDWDGLWDGKVSIDDKGWIAELAIPFKTLKFKPGLEGWGFNVARTIRRREESMRWASPRHDVNFFQASEAGDINGLVGLRQGLGLALTPFSVGRWDYDRTGKTTQHLKGQPGLDAVYRVTPNLSADLTVNTDFSEAQVDKAQINLTRFKLFFPEKRDFFLEDAGLFSFADLGTDLLPFWSRRIGLSGNGVRLPILAGGKLTGRQGGYNIGLLDVQTDAFQNAPERNMLAARITRNVGRQSTIGGVFTRGDPDGTGQNSCFGLDANYGTTKYLGNKNLTASVWGLGTQTVGETLGKDDLAYGASVAYPNDRWNWNLSFKEIQSNFNPKLGFVPRAGIRRYSGKLLFEPRLHTAIKKLKFGITPEVITGLGNKIETADAVAKVFAIENIIGDIVALEVVPDFERLSEPFEIAKGHVIPVADYTTTRYGIVLDSAKKRGLNAKAELTVGQFFNGRSNNLVSSMSWRPSGHFNLTGTYEGSRIKLPDGKFSTNVETVGADVLFSPELSWSNFFQYDDEASEYGINSRWRWVQGPGHQVFVVFSEKLSRVNHVISPTLEGVAVKLQYTIQL